MKTGFWTILLFSTTIVSCKWLSGADQVYSVYVLVDSVSLNGPVMDAVGAFYFPEYSTAISAGVKLAESYKAAIPVSGTLFLKGDSIYFTPLPVWYAAYHNMKKLRIGVSEIDSVVVNGDFKNTSDKLVLGTDKGNVIIMPDVLVKMSRPSYYEHIINDLENACKYSKIIDKS